MNWKMIVALGLTAGLVLHTGCGGGAVRQPNAIVKPAATFAQFEANLEAQRNALKIPGMAVIILKNQTSWSKGFGMANVQNSIAVAPTTSFHLASLTKTFAAFILMQLVDEGKLDLDTPVSTYGVTLPSPGVIRVRHLLTHTSEGTPGSAFIYNGDRFALLSAVIQGASGKPFSLLVCERIILPLSLAQTAPNDLLPADFNCSGHNLTTFRANLAKGYNLSNGVNVETPYPAIFSAAAGLISSAADMAVYSNAIDANVLVSQQTKDRMFTPTLSNSGTSLPYGLGWFVQQHNGTKLVWHFGNWTGNSSLIIKVPERGLTFVVLANSDMLSRNFSLAAGNVLVSPVATEFIAAFVDGNVALP